MRQRLFLAFLAATLAIPLFAATVSALACQATPPSYRGFVGAYHVPPVGTPRITAVKAGLNPPSTSANWDPCNPVNTQWFSSTWVAIVPQPSSTSSIIQIGIIRIGGVPSQFFYAEGGCNGAQPTPHILPTSPGGGVHTYAINHVTNGDWVMSIDGVTRHTINDSNSAISCWAPAPHVTSAQWQGEVNNYAGEHGACNSGCISVPAGDPFKVSQMMYRKQADQTWYTSSDGANCVRNDIIGFCQQGGSGASSMFLYSYPNTNP